MPVDIFYDRAARFVSDLVRNPEDRFSHNEAHTVQAANKKIVEETVWMHRIIFAVVVHRCKKQLSSLRGSIHKVFFDKVYKVVFVYRIYMYTCTV